MSNSQVAVQRLLRYIFIGFAIGVVPAICGIFLKFEAPDWLVYSLSFVAGIPLWLSWRYGIQGLANILTDVIYCVVVAGLVGLIQVFIRSKIVRNISLVFFFALFFWLNFISAQSVFRDMGELGELFGKKLRDNPEFAREFIEFFERDHKKLSSP